MFCEENDNTFPLWFNFILIIIINQLNIQNKIKFTKIILEKKSCGKTQQQFTMF